LRAIGVTGAKRSPLFPDLQSTSEAGFPGLVVDSWFAVFAPRGLAAPIQASLTKALHEVLTDPAIVQKMELVGAQVHASTPSELAQLLQSDLQTWKVVLQKAKVTLD
jgi:tripartite-type tricarboxylate transporter receptor subunit TctC